MYYDRIESGEGFYISCGNYKTFDLAKSACDFGNKVYIRKIFEDKGEEVVTSWRLVKNKTQSFCMCHRVDEKMNEKLSDAWTKAMYG